MSNVIFLCRENIWPCRVKLISDLSQERITKGITPVKVLLLLLVATEVVCTNNSRCPRKALSKLCPQLLAPIPLAPRWRRPWSLWTDSSASVWVKPSCVAAGRAPLPSSVIPSSALCCLPVLLSASPASSAALASNDLKCVNPVYIFKAKEEPPSTLLVLQRKEDQVASGWERKCMFNQCISAL